MGAAGITRLVALSTFARLGLRNLARRRGRTALTVLMIAGGTLLSVFSIGVGDGTYDVFVTLSSPYDTPQRYADGWQTLDPDGNVLGTHTLLHDHAAEQPFTRVQRGVTIPAGIESVTVQGRDQANGFGGLTLTVAVPDRS